MSHVHGKFVWFEHLSPDTAQARKFYDTLLGWHTEMTPMGGPEPYPLIMNGGDGIGGFRTAPRGVPAMWMSYLSVADVDATHTAAVAAGAKSLMAPEDFGAVGRGATLADPAGAAFSIFKNAQGDRADNARTPVGDWHWNELMSPDELKALGFYERVFGYQHDSMDMGPMGTYYLLKKDGAMRGGLMRAPMADTPPMWVPYVAVADCDATAAKAKSLGAQVIVEPQDIPNVGRFATFIDPQGAMLAVMKPTP
jgi:predicted enzyme related to lactoylglutathione lyase